jgi:membrane protein implicated in regulation of membrane protease activity
MARWLGVLAFIAALLCLLAFLTPFFDTGVFNAATGALGLWTWYAAFVVWVFLASVMLTVTERRLAKEARTAAPAGPAPAATEGAVR